MRDTFAVIADTYGQMGEAARNPGRIVRRTYATTEMEVAASVARHDGFRAVVDGTELSVEWIGVQQKCLPQA